MSQAGVHRIALRAICATVAMCALFFALLVSGSPPAAGGGSGVHAASHDVVSFCHDYDLSAAISKNVTPGKRAPEKRAECPCCLAAHAGQAVILPERAALSIRIEPMATPVLYSVSLDSPRRFALGPTINGARAPPSGAAFS